MAKMAPCSGAAWPTHTHRQTVQDGIVQDTHARPLAEGEWRELVSESE